MWRKRRYLKTMSSNPRSRGRKNHVITLLRSVLHLQIKCPLTFCRASSTFFTTESKLMKSIWNSVLGSSSLLTRNCIMTFSLNRSSGTETGKRLTERTCSFSSQVSRIAGTRTELKYHIGSLMTLAQWERLMIKSHVGYAQRMNMTLRIRK